MSIEMIAVNIAVVSLVFVPYFLLVVIGQKETRKLAERFHQEVKKHNLVITEKENWNLNIMGIDPVKQKLLFVQRREEELFVNLVDLSVIKQCLLSCENKEMKIHGEKEEVLQRIDLELVPVNGQLNHRICLYNYDLNFDQDYEMKRAQKWNKTINNSLSKSFGFKKVA